MTDEKIEINGMQALYQRDPNPLGELGQMNSGVYKLYKVSGPEEMPKCIIEKTVSIHNYDEIPTRWIPEAHVITKGNILAEIATLKRAFALGLGPRLFRDEYDEHANVYRYYIECMDASYDKFVFDTLEQITTRKVQTSDSVANLFEVLNAILDETLRVTTIMIEHVGNSITSNFQIADIKLSNIGISTNPVRLNIIDWGPCRVALMACNPYEFALAIIESIAEIRKELHYYTPPAIREQFRADFQSLDARVNSIIERSSTYMRTFSDWLSECEQYKTTTQNQLDKIASGVVSSDVDDDPYNNAYTNAYANDAYDDYTNAYNSGYGTRATARSPPRRQDPQDDMASLAGLFGSRPVAPVEDDMASLAGLFGSRPIVPPPPEERYTRQSIRQRNRSRSIDRSSRNRSRSRSRSSRSRSRSV
jgi:hypothetical protein